MTMTCVVENLGEFKKLQKNAFTKPSFFVRHHPPPLISWINVVSGGGGSLLSLVFYSTAHPLPIPSFSPLSSGEQEQTTIYYIWQQ